MLAFKERQNRQKITLFTEWHAFSCKHHKYEMKIEFFRKSEETDPEFFTHFLIKKFLKT
jgi:hypothetical protein